VYLWGLVLAEFLGMVGMIGTGVCVLVIAIAALGVTITENKKLCLDILVAEFLSSGVLLYIITSNYMHFDFMINNALICIGYNTFLILSNCIAIYTIGIGILLISSWFKMAMSPLSR